VHHTHVSLCSSDHTAEDKNILYSHSVWQGPLTRLHVYMSPAHVNPVNNNNYDHKHHHKQHT